MSVKKALTFVAGLPLMLSDGVSAHGAGDLVRESLHQWPGDLISAALIVGCGAIYLRGLARLWRRAGHGAGIRRWQAAAYIVGLAALAVALLSPLVWLSSVTFSAHMVQHELLMVVAAPLLVLGQPGIASLWALPARFRERVPGRIHRSLLQVLWRTLTSPAIAFLLHGAAIWIWHAPSLFDAAMRSEAVHFVQHVTFLGTAVFFWWGMAHGRYGQLGYGAAVFFVFLTALHTNLLAALLTLSPAPWMVSYSTAAGRWQFDPILDQQLAGLLMWVPFGVIFIGLGLALLAAWLKASDRSTRVTRALP